MESEAISSPLLRTRWSTLCCQRPLSAGDVKDTAPAARPYSFEDGRKEVAAGRRLHDRVC